jgi:P27 family predicted phage terminase small subunit
MDAPIGGTARPRLPGARPARPPAGLCQASRAFWTRLVREYDIADAGGLALLELAAQAYRRLVEARGILDKQGVTVMDRHGQVRAHPLVNVERDARIAVVATLKQLGLDLEPVGKGGRPGGR